MSMLLDSKMNCPLALVMRLKSFNVVRIVAVLERVGGGDGDGDGVCVCVCVCVLMLLCCL